jgi:flavodoxin
MSRKILIAFYSWSGNTRFAAEQIQKAVGGTLFEIRPKKAYPEDYGECVAAARKECPAGFRPELAALPDVEKYDTVFVGSPDWCSTIAPPVRTFLTSCSLAGKTVVPFFTHGGGRMQNCERAVRDACPGSVVLTAETFLGSDVRGDSDAVARFAQNALEE